jgi:D-galactarolactone cycloisomerase
MRITAIRLRRVVHELDPPFCAAWDPAPRRRFEATIVLVETDEGLTGIGSGDTMDGFEAYEHLFVGRDPLDVEHHARVLETIGLPRRPLLAARGGALGSPRESSE